MRLSPDGRTRPVRGDRVAARCDRHLLSVTEGTTGTLTRLRTICLAYPETSETSSWGHPALARHASISRPIIPVHHGPAQTRVESNRRSRCRQSVHREDVGEDRGPDRRELEPTDQLVAPTSGHPARGVGVSSGFSDSHITRTVVIPRGAAKASVAPITSRQSPGVACAGPHQKVLRMFGASPSLVDPRATRLSQPTCPFLASIWALLAQIARTSSDRRASSLPRAQNWRAASRASSQISRVSDVTFGAVNTRGGTWPSAVGAYSIETWSKAGASCGVPSSVKKRMLY